jgi:hypothetical protein
LPLLPGPVFLLALSAIASLQVLDLKNKNSANYSKLGPSKTPKTERGNLKLTRSGHLLLSSWPFKPCFIPNFGSVSLKSERNCL